MDIIVAGQRIVTKLEFVEAARGFDTVESLDIESDFVAGGLAGWDALDGFLADFEVETDIDREDAAYFKSLLRRMPRELRARKTSAVPAVPAAVVTAEVEAMNDALDDGADDITADWTAADFDSYEVLAALGTTNPAAAVTRAREPRAERRAVRAALRVVRDEIPAEVAA